MSTATQTQPADQADILAANEQLTANLAALQRQLAEARTALDTANAERGQFQTQLTAATEQLTAARGDNTRLQAQLTEARQGNASLQEIVTARTRERDDLKAENTALQTKMADFNKSVAAEVAKLGITKLAVQLDPKAAATDKPTNLTDECRAAKGN